MLGKYSLVFSLSLQNELIYRLNFVLWRFRNILRFLLAYFLWSGVFYSVAGSSVAGSGSTGSPQVIFGYQENQMLTYVFGTLLVGTFVLSAPSGDNMGTEIANGDLGNYLLKPLNYLRYWFVRDLASKLLNMSFAVVEVSLLYFFLRPQLQLPSGLETWGLFFLMCVLAMVLNYFLSCAARFVAFWTPESTWGIAFVVIVLVDVLGGGIFPIDILPRWLQIVLEFTPFPYLIYYPVAVFLGKVAGWEAVRVILQTLVWVVVMGLVSRFIWYRGLKQFSSEGR